MCSWRPPLSAAYLPGSESQGKPKGLNVLCDLSRGGPAERHEGKPIKQSVGVHRLNTTKAIQSRVQEQQTKRAPEAEDTPLSPQGGSWDGQMEACMQSVEEARERGHRPRLGAPSSVAQSLLCCTPNSELLHTLRGADEAMRSQCQLPCSRGLNQKEGSQAPQLGHHHGGGLIMCLCATASEHISAHAACHTRARG